MKKILVILTLIFIGGLAVAQSPEKMNYQAVARDLSGLPMVSATVNLQFDILEGSPTGTVAYSETQTKTTNQFGLFTAEIGSGAVVSGTFSAIGWATNSYYLRITINGDVMPATQLLSVPYALYAKSSGGAGTSLTAGSGIDITGGVVTATSDTSSTNELQDLSWDTTDSNIINLSNGTGISLSSNTPTANQVLMWNGANWTAQTISGSWTQGTGNDIYNNTDSVGIGTVDPKSLFQLGDFTHLSPLAISATEKYSFSSYNAYWNGTTVKNTTGGISGVSIIGDDNGNPVYSVLLFDPLPAGGDIMSVNPVLRMNLRGRGLAINADVASAALEVDPIDSAAIFMDVPDDNSQPTLSYRAPGGASHILGLRVPNTLTNSYTLTYPVDLPTTNGSPLVSDLAGNLSWGTPASSPWGQTGTTIHPNVLTDNVGIGSNSAAYALEIKRSQTGTGPLLGITNPTTGDATIHFSTGTGNFSIGRNANTFRIAHASNLASNVRMIIGSTGNVGFGLLAPTARVHAEGFGGQAIMGQNSSSTTATMNLMNFGGGPAMTVTNGTVGINIAAPTARFHLNSTMRLENLGGTAPVAGAVLTSIDANGNAQWQAPAAAKWTGSAGTTVLTTATDNVGIGTATPGAKLHVYNNANIATTIQSNTGLADLNIDAAVNRADIVFKRSGATEGSMGYNLTNDYLFLNDGIESLVSRNGRIGIGTSTPASKLDVEGGVAIGATYSGATAAPGNGLIVEGNVGIATTSPSPSGNFTVQSQVSQFVVLDLPGSAGTVVAGSWSGTGVNPQLRFSGVSPGIIDIGQDASGNFVVEGNDVPRLTVMNAGNVGIGVSTPSNKLDVEGAMAIGVNYSGTASAPADGLIVEGRVGIGTNSPGMIGGSTDYLTISSKGGYSSGSIASIEVKGNTNAGNDPAAKIDFLNGLGVNNIARVEARTSGGSTAQGQLAFYTNDGTLNERMRITQAGDVGIGTAWPTAMLSVNGAANKPGGGAWTVFSDERSKENITNYSKGLKELLQLRPVSFTYKKEFNWGSKTYVGLIAQEVEKVVPTMVTKKEVNNIKDFREVDPNEINYMLINAIKEQQKMIEKLQQEIDALKK